MTKPDIYDKHDAAFKYVSAYVILDAQKERVATIAFKFPKDGAGRLYAYVHYIGALMVRDYAGGYGYDKRSAAVTHAAAHIMGDISGARDESFNAGIAQFKAALSNIGGKDWADALRDNGFIVLQAV